MSCHEMKRQLGEFLDGELPEPRNSVIKTHVHSCADCQTELQMLRNVATALGDQPAISAPRAALWAAIETRLAAARRGGLSSHTSSRRLLVGWRSLASAAVMLVAIGLGWVFVTGPGASPAVAARLDFRPLLERDDGDIEQGIQDLIAAHGGGKTDLATASRKMRIRVRAPEQLPGGLVRRSLYMLHLGGEHRSLGFHYSGAAGQLLLLQCPPVIERNYGGQECIACEINSSKGEIARAGPVRLAHFASDNLCVCVVSTLDEEQLAAALKAVEIDY
jgi:hypothetical protein